MKNKISLFFVLGLTASGKTDLATNLALMNPCGGILNADSIQFYSDLNIGSAKPDFEKYPEIDYFLFNISKAPSLMTAGLFRKKALEILKSNLDKKMIFVTGGSGFYIRALEIGMYPIQPVPSFLITEFQNIKKKKGLHFLYEDLVKRDSGIEKKINPKDEYRIIRALSIMENEGKSISQIKKDFIPQKLPWNYRKIGILIEKEDLKKRIKDRVKNMMKMGFIDEVESLLNQGHEDWKPLKSVGYKEVLAYLQNKIKKEDLFEEIVKSTLSLAKKQKTWFKKDKNIEWYPLNILEKRSRMKHLLINPLERKA